MTTVLEYNTTRRKADLPLVRFNLRRYSDQDVLDLRHAYEALYEISAAAPGDLRGYWAVARGHGYDQDLCHLDGTLFLTWHRAYVYWFEKALSSALANRRGDQELVLTLPYWDWTVFDEEKDAENGIPKVLDDDTYVDEDGQEKPNPLKRARSLYRVESQGLTGDDELTHRYPAQLRDRIPWLAEQVEGLYDESDYATFNSDFDGGAHGAVHVWVGGRDASSPLPFDNGDMSAVVSAAFDPIFWLHHCMVDRVWFEWQKRHGDGTVPQRVRDHAVYGGFTGAEVIDAEGFLMYTYGDGIAAASGDDASVAEGTEEAPLPPTMTVPIGHLAGGFQSARLHFQGMQPPKESYELRVFVNQDGADESTPTDGNPSYAGALMFFGHGKCHGAPGHCNPSLEPRDAFDRRGGHPLRPRNYDLNVTRALRALTAEGGLDEAVLSFVVLDAAGDQVAPEELDFESITLVTR